MESKRIYLNKQILLNSLFGFLITAGLLLLLNLGTFAAGPLYWLLSVIPYALPIAVATGVVTWFVQSVIALFQELAELRQQVSDLQEQLKKDGSPTTD